MDVMSPPRGGQNDRQSVDVSSPVENDLDDSPPPTYRTVPTQILNRQTQPTQLLELSSPDSLFTNSPSRPVVQVAASSPAQSPPARKQSLLASAMAPAGTVFRRPYVPAAPKPIQIDSDDEGPIYQGGSSDSDESLLRSDIKPSNFSRKTERVEESPQATQGKDRFHSITASSFYQPQPKLASAFNPNDTSGVKRNSDTMASAYGSVSKKPRQNAPSRAMPVVIDDEEESDLEIDDVADPNLRAKVRRMHELFPRETVRLCHKALMMKKGNFEDASDYLVAETSSLGPKPKARHVDLTGSDDELLYTPRPAQGTFGNGVRPTLVNDVRQQPKKPVVSIGQRWSTQNPVKIAPRQLAPAPKKLDVFNTPQPVLKKRTLIRGRKDPSSPPRQSSQPQVYHIESDEEDAGSESEPEDLSFNGRLLHFFNTCTPEDLVDTAGITKEVASYFVTKRPFKSLNMVEKVQSEKPASSKSKVKPRPIGEKIYDKCHEMLKAYEAVDYLVKRCENIAKPLAQSMSSWGVNVYGGKGEVDLASIYDSQRACHDSGIGTPVSDEDGPIKSMGKGGFFGQPVSMAEDIRMKDYQVVGMNWLNLLYNAGHSCILADDMGLGKTCQVIAFLAHLCEVRQNGPHLVVVPAATLENWLKEFQRFAPGLTVEPYYGKQAEREQMRYTMDEARDEINVIVTTYETAKAKEDNPWLRHYGFNCTIYDEGHMLKNATSMVTKNLVRIRSEFRLLLTGTPLQNNLKELISLLAFLMPEMFNEKKDELQSIFTHNVKAMDANHEALLSAQRIARARSMLTPFILRRKKNQVLKDLPKKERNVVYCELTPAQKELYDAQIERAYDIRARRLAGEVGLNESANVLMKLRQAAIHPFLFRRLYRDELLPGIAKQCLKDPQWVNSQAPLIVQELTAYSDMEVHTLCAKPQHKVLHKYALNRDEWLASGKVQQMLRLFRQWMGAGHRILLFSQFTMVLDILELVLSKEKIGYFRLDGNTPVGERQDMIDEFCDNDNHIPVFMLSTKAGGAGINLAKASKVLLFDESFNPQESIQAENRAHRIGQVKDVEIVRLITRGTVEEQIYAMGLTKLKLDEQVAGDEDGESDKLKERIEQENLKKVEEMFFQKLEDPKDNAGIKVEELERKVREISSDSSLSTLSNESSFKDDDGNVDKLTMRPKTTRNASQQSKGPHQSKLSFAKK